MSESVEFCIEIKLWGMGMCISMQTLDEKEGLERWDLCFVQGKGKLGEKLGRKPF